MEVAQFLTIEISRIIPDPDQPRRFFDETALSELTESVKVNGVIQPIMLRPNGDIGYMVVCGERRYRASIAAGLTEIPAVVRELTNEQALELQIIENLQRKDVHPMEEAVAFRSLLDQKKFSILEIASRVGKSVFYVRQRLKLNDLTPEWQQIFFNNVINLRDALLVCPLPEKAQEAVYLAFESKLKVPGAKVQLDTWTMDKFKGDLNDAAFDLNDSSLFTSAGACSNCQYNTSVSLLFPDHANAPRCMNTSCFKTKSELHLEKALKEAQEDPSVVLINNMWHGDNDLVKRLIKEGHAVLKRHDDFEKVDMPEAPDLDQLKEEYEYETEEGEKTFSEIEEEFKELQVSYDAEMQIYNQKINSGKYVRGFIVNGSSNEVGKYIYVDLKKKPSNKSKDAAPSSTGSGNDDVKSEIDRISKREERNCELDGIKIHIGILEQLKNCKELNLPSLLHQSIDRGLMVYLLLESGGYSFRDEIRKKLKGFPKRPESRNQYHADYFQSLSKTTDDQLAFIVRRLAYEKFGNRNLQYGINTDDTTMFLIAGYLGIDIKALEEEQGQKVAKRKIKVSQRIVELKAQLKPISEKPMKKTKADKPAKDTPAGKSKNKSAIAKGISSLINKDE